MRTRAATRCLGPLVESLPDARFDALQWHSYQVELPPGATQLAHSGRLPAELPDR